MANFLQISEPEAANLDAQSDATGDKQRLHDLAARALVAQYGNAAADPEMWSGAVNANTDAQTAPAKITATNAQLPLATQKAHMDVQQQQQDMQRAAELRAAFGVQSAVKGGMDAATAFDQIVAPNVGALGLSDTDAATLRDHLVKNPDTIDALVASLQGPAKPEGMPVMYTDANGNPGAAYITDRGTTVQMNLPSGAQIHNKVAGAPIQVDMGGGKYALIQHDQYGNLSVTDINGTPVPAETAQAAIARANAQQQNANTSAYSAGVRGNNSEFGGMPGTAPGTPAGAGGPPMSIAQAIHGQESGGHATSRTSVDGAMGGWQITPSFIKTFGHPGEDPTNPVDNAAIAQRGLAYYSQQYGGDPARVAVAYFSGPQNVAPPGSPTPYKNGALKDGNGTSVATYVNGVMSRMGASGYAAPAAAGKPAAAGVTPIEALPPKGQVAALRAATGIVNGAEQLASIDGQIDNIKKLTGPFSVGLGALTEGVPGTPAANMKAALSTLRSQGLTSWLSSLKNGSNSTGIGRVLQSEAAAAMNSYGALEQSQSEDQFRYHLGIFQQRVHQLQGNVEAAFKKQYGTDPYTASGVPGPQAPAAPAGQASNTAALRAKYGL